MSLHSQALPVNYLMEKAHLSRFYLEKERQISENRAWNETRLQERARRTHQNHMDIVGALKQKREMRYSNTLRDSQIHSEMMLRKVKTL